MPSDFEGTFDSSRKEWTARKHKILGHYFRVAGEMLKLLRKPIAFVDGFAGANKYGDEEEGSTRTMVEEALRLREKYGALVTVFACESDPNTYKKLIGNLGTHIDSGLLRPYNSPHHAVAQEIKDSIKGWPSVVFLDPNRPTQMSMQGDINPWLTRPKTDLLGLYFGQNVFRIVQSAKIVDRTAHVAQEVAGSGWNELKTESEIYDRFVTSLREGATGKYVGLYKLEKRDQRRVAYGIFGVSEHLNGYWLLSDAVARDFSRLSEFKTAKTQNQLFADDPEYNEELKRHQLLTDLARPIISGAPDLTAKELGKQLLERNRDQLFGQFAERDFGRVLRELRKAEG
jgi:three-Cys-motif partner protein